MGYIPGIQGLNKQGFPFGNFPDENAEAVVTRLLPLGLQIAQSRSWLYPSGPKVSIICIRRALDCGLHKKAGPAGIVSLLLYLVSPRPSFPGLWFYNPEKPSLNLQGSNNRKVFGLSL